MTRWAVTVFVLNGMLLALPALAVRMPVDVPEQEELEIAVGGADAVVEGFITAVLDTFVLTSQAPGVGRSVTWLQVQVVSKLKGPLGIGPGSSIRAYLGPEGEDPIPGQDRTRLFFLLRNSPGRFLPGLVPQAVHWILCSDSRDGSALRSRVQGIVQRQSRESLVRQANVVVVGHPTGNARPCPLPIDGTCLNLAVDSILAGRTSSRSIPIAFRGFGIPPGPAIYFLRKAASGRHVIVGRTAGVLVPPTFIPADWFPMNGETIRRQWHRLH